MLLFLAACLAWGPLAVFTCPAAYAIAAGVTEGKTVKDIEAKYDSAIKDLENTKKEIDSVSATTKALIDQVNYDKKVMDTVRTELNKASIGGRLAIKDTSKYFIIFQAGITALRDNCV